MTAENRGPAAVRARQFAIYKQVWSLTREDRAELEHCYIAGTTVGDFMHHIDDEVHPYKDFLTVCRVRYEVQYMDCGLAQLDTLPEDTLLLISFRHRKNPLVAIALVRIAEPGHIDNFAAYKYLAPDYRSSMLPNKKDQVDTE